MFIVNLSNWFDLTVSTTPTLLLCFGDTKRLQFRIGKYVNKIVNVKTEM